MTKCMNQAMPVNFPLYWRTSVVEAESIFHTVLFESESNFTLHIYCRFPHSCDSHQLLQTLVVWISCISPEVWKVDAACQVHVWRVSEGCTIISSSPLSEFIVLNFCPSLNIRWKHGTHLQLVNGCPLAGDFSVVCVQITNSPCLFPCLAPKHFVKCSGEEEKNGQAQ